MEEEAPLCRNGHGTMVRIKDKSRKKGWLWRCRTCSMKWVTQNREKFREHQRRYREAHREKAREYSRRYNASHPEVVKANMQRIRDRNRAHVATEAAHRGDCCEVEGCSASNGLSWHHRDPDTKIANISSGITGCWSLSRLTAELAKCDLLCYDHHVIVDAERRLAARR